MFLFPLVVGLLVCLSKAQTEYIVRLTFSDVYDHLCAINSANLVEFWKFNTCPWNTGPIFGNFTREGNSIRRMTGGSCTIDQGLIDLTEASNTKSVCDMTAQLTQWWVTSSPPTQLSMGREGSVTMFFDTYEGGCSDPSKAIVTTLSQDVCSPSGTCTYNAGWGYWVRTECINDWQNSFAVIASETAESNAASMRHMKTTESYVAVLMGIFVVVLVIVAILALILGICCCVRNSGTARPMGKSASREMSDQPAGRE